MTTDDDIVGPTNLGNPAKFAIAELAEVREEITNPRSELVYKTLPGEYPEQRYPDIALAKKILNWQPQVTLRAGLERTVAYFSDRQSSGKL